MFERSEEEYRKDIESTINMLAVFITFVIAGLIVAGIVEFCRFVLSILA